MLLAEAMVYCTLTLFGTIFIDETKVDSTVTAIIVPKMLIFLLFNANNVTDLRLHS